VIFLFLVLKGDFDEVLRVLKEEVLRSVVFMMMG